MTVGEERAWWRKRFFAALAIVVAVVLIAPVSNAALSMVGEGPDSAFSGAAIRASDLITGGDVNAALSRIERFAEGESVATDAVSPEFSEEIGFLNGAREVRASGSVVGYVVDCESEAALIGLRAHMEQRGWSSVPLGGLEGFTFLKDSGRCTWALATCMQVGDSTSVVIRFA